MNIEFVIRKGVHYYYYFLKKVLPEISLNPTITTELGWHS